MSQGFGQGDARPNAGRRVGGIALGVLLGAVAPLSLLIEVFMPVMLVLLPSLALVALDRWSGSAAANVGAALTLAFAALYGGAPLALICLFAVVLPPMILLRMKRLPFFRQLRASIAAFGIGVLLCVVTLYLSFGANMIERLLKRFPDMVRALPEEYLQSMMGYLSMALGSELAPQQFFELYERMIDEMIQLYRLELPQNILSGALMSAILCAWLSNWMGARRGEAAPGAFVPLRAWALSASTTLGLLLMTVAGWALTWFKFNAAETVFYAAYGIATVAFGFQALGSFARKLRASSLRLGTRRGILIAIAALGFLLLPDALLVYGGASAILGSRGVIIQRIQNQNHSDDDGHFGGGA